MKNNLFLLDLPEKEEKDAIGYSVYVDNIIDAIDSDAKMIGLISNYGSGKSTIINMVKGRKETSGIKFIPVNLWKIKENNKVSNNTNIEDETVEIHKLLLKRLISSLPNSSNKDYFTKKIDNKYALFNISMRNKNDIFALYSLLALFLFNIIAKLDIVGFSVPRVCNFIIDLTVAIGFVYILSGAKLYLSFKKDSTERKINESDTIDCFNEIIEEYLDKHSSVKQIVICIEDLDRYNDSDFVIRVLEQIYKFYSENNEKVKFIISLKPPYLLAKDSNNKNIISNGDDTTNVIEGINKKIVSEYKELYEKLFDLIINLQTVSFQNYGSVLLELISHKEKDLGDIGLKIPKDEEKIGMWGYLYKGKSVSIRDIKHRFNYFIILYENLYQHKNTLTNPELISINVETCLFVSYLEDEYSADFYELLNDSKKFSDIVSEYLMKKSFSLLDADREFDFEIKSALIKGLINADYFMYFYKYPKNKPINNVFDSKIMNAIFTNSMKNISNFDEYCKNASPEIIHKAIREKCDSYGIPDIIFENQILYKATEAISYDKILEFLENNCIFSCDNGVKEVQKMLKKIKSLNSEKLLNDYINLLYNDLNSNYNDEQILQYRKEIVKILGLNSDISCLYDSDMPLITLDEAKQGLSAKIIFSLISKERISEAIYEIIDYVSENLVVEYQTLVNFLDEINDIDKNIFRTIFYKFNFKKYSRNNRCLLFDKNYEALSLNNINELYTFVNHIEALTIKKEKEIIDNLMSLPETERCKKEEIYVKIINSLEHISVVTKKYIPKLSKNYQYTEKIENELFDIGYYSQYCYSRFNRLKHVIYEEDKFEVLKPYYVLYFKNSKLLSEKYLLDIPVLEYIKNNISYTELTFDKIKLLIKLPQNVEDFEIVYQKKYENPNSSSAVNELRIYLRSIKKIESSSETEFVEKIIEEVQSKRLSLSLNSYKHIKSILNISNIRKIQRIKNLCKKED